VISCSVVGSVGTGWCSVPCGPVDTVNLAFITSLHESSGSGALYWDYWVLYAIGFGATLVCETEIPHSAASSVRGGVGNYNGICKSNYFVLCNMK
jgi:hypothetical protein